MMTSARIFRISFISKIGKFCSEVPVFYFNHDKVLFFYKNHPILFINYIFSPIILCFSPWTIFYIYKKVPI